MPGGFPGFTFGLPALGNRLDGGHIAAANGDQELDTIIAQKLVYALDGLTLIIKHVKDGLGQLNMLWPVIAPATPAI